MPGCAPEKPVPETVMVSPSTRPVFFETVVTGVPEVVLTTGAPATVVTGVLEMAWAAASLPSGVSGAAMAMPTGVVNAKATAVVANAALLNARIFLLPGHSRSPRRHRANRPQVRLAYVCLGEPKLHHFS